MAKDPEFTKARSDTIENLQAIQTNLNRCVDQGMVDADNTYYNELLLLIDEAKLSNSLPELMEVVSKAKILEVDIAVWLAGHGQTTISLPWPRPKKG